MATRKQLPFDPVARAREHWIEHGWIAPAPGMAVVTSIMRVHQILLARIDDLLRPEDLTFARYEVLMLLLFSSRGSMPLGKVGERLQVHPASVTNAVDRLERQGLVRRTAHPTDGRRTLAELTTKGRRVARRTTELLNREAFLDLGLTSAEKSGLFGLLRILRQQAGDFA